ncbi:hypothetical protein AURDEDRAFT_179192 [Auricularia subglabra TFB-10046 SS5]|nr:hypothetical protein AURDEDRAFT_179192 [Auricularia subglabra TFB-10046 SS5]
MNKYLLIAALYASTAQAYCYYDSFGRRRCTGLSNVARIIIAVCFSVGAILLLCALAAFQRRRIHRRNMTYIAQPAGGPPQGAFVQQPSYGPQGSYGPGQPGYSPYPHQYATGGYDPTNVGPQPPQPAYNPGQPRPSGYDIETPPPPQYGSYAPPAGPPPGK